MIVWHLARDGRISVYGNNPVRQLIHSSPPEQEGGETRYLLRGCFLLDQDRVGRIPS